MAEIIRLYECSQCGASDMQDLGGHRLRCLHCGSLFRLLTDEPTLTIQKGANVVFGKHANVEIRGDVEIEDGADVQVDGKVTLVRGKQKKLFKLELIEKGDPAKAKTA